MAEDVKVWLRAAATATKSGLPLPEAHRIANAERERYLAQQAGTTCREARGRVAAARRSGALIRNRSA